MHWILSPQGSNGDSWPNHESGNLLINPQINLASQTILGWIWLEEVSHWGCTMKGIYIYLQVHLSSYPFLLSFYCYKASSFVFPQTPLLGCSVSSSRGRSSGARWPWVWTHESNYIFPSWGVVLRCFVTGMKSWLAHMSKMATFAAVVESVLMNHCWIA